MAPPTLIRPVDADRPLAPVSITVDIGFALLLVVGVLRYFSNHMFDGAGQIVMALATSSGVAYAVGALRPSHPGQRAAGIFIAAVLWLPLAILAPSFGWCAFALFFALHRDLSRGPAILASSLVVLAVSLGLLFMSRGQDFGLVLGPFFGGLVLSFAYATVDRALENRKLLIDELVEARERLAQSERQAGALSERNRVANELHDTVVQRTASALLLLESGSQTSGAADPFTVEAREVLRASLAETRALVQGLTIPRAEGQTLVDGLTALASEHSAALTVTGDPVEPDEEARHALLRVAQEALTNVDRHAKAGATRITASFFPDAIGLDIADDGIGFDPTIDTGTGHGLRAMAWRLESLGGEFTLETSPGTGTVVGGYVRIQGLR